jgi:hypothetical protein
MEEQLLYDYFLHWVDVESPEQLIERFRSLFLDGQGQDDEQVVLTLEKVIHSKFAQDEFRYVLNRCCHILVNRWQAHPQYRYSVPTLIGIFDQIPTSSAGSFQISRSRSVKRLRELVRNFTETEQYVILRRLSQVLAEAIEAAEEVDAGSRPLGSLMRRYPYLYEHCLLNEDSVQEEQNTVKTLQSEIQHQFELDLSRYATYMVRRSRLAREKRLTPQALIPPLPNPTLLSDRELGQALKHYVGRIDGTNTYRDMAHSFLTLMPRMQSYGAFKDNLYEYITASIDSDYGNRQFNNQVYQQLKQALPENNSKALSDFLIVRTCSQLLNFLVVDNPQNPRHFTFIDLLTNLGPVLTTGLLLKIVLICRKVKPYLERRFSILFNHYESYRCDTVGWLVQALENMNVALSLHFGNLDLSFIR